MTEDCKVAGTQVERLSNYHKSKFVEELVVISDAPESKTGFNVHKFSSNRGLIHEPHELRSLASDNLVLFYMINIGHYPSVLICGPPGCGKSSNIRNIILLYNHLYPGNEVIYVCPKRDDEDVIHKTFTYERGVLPGTAKFSNVVITPKTMTEFQSTMQDESTRNIMLVFDDFMSTDRSSSSKKYNDLVTWCVRNLRSKNIKVVASSHFTFSNAGNFSKMREQFAVVGVFPSSGIADSSFRWLSRMGMTKQRFSHIKKACGKYECLYAVGQPPFVLASTFSMTTDPGHSDTYGNVADDYVEGSSVTKEASLHKFIDRHSRQVTRTPYVLSEPIHVGRLPLRGSTNSVLDRPVLTSEPSKRELAFKRKRLRAAPHFNKKRRKARPIRSLIDDLAEVEEDSEDDDEDDPEYEYEEEETDDHGWSDDDGVQ